MGSGNSQRPKVRHRRLSRRLGAGTSISRISTTTRNSDARMRRHAKRSAAARPQDPSETYSSPEPARPRWPESGWDSKPQATLADQLERIATLHASGALNDAEFAAAKALLFESHGNPES